MGSVASVGRSAFRRAPAEGHVANDARNELGERLVGDRESHGRLG